MIKKVIEESISLKIKLLKDETLIQQIENIADYCVFALKEGKKVLFCGNGGSAADAQHLAAELSGRFYYDRPPLDGEALHTNTSYLTAVANDYDYSEVYSRIIEAKGKNGDVLFCLSTSGNSENILKAAEKAKEKGMKVIGMTGLHGGKLAPFCDFLIKIPSESTPRIQENHILTGHIICEIIEKQIFPNW